MDCPKCAAEMNERKFRTLEGLVLFDQCSSCKGFWFDNGEAEKLKDAYEPDFIDNGDPETGEAFNKIRDIDCPRCGKRMEQVNDERQRHIQLEVCREHGVYMDAGEFKDYKNETVMDVFRDVAAFIRGG
ncbi:MAG: zf-TFIIB domain-containing protein [Myxococcota bacterium]|jgi:Zn-finger nucleic acid-binding protein|nr:zf-TFIIB domain-containing protein [Myxococcota bacterium]